MADVGETIAGRYELLGRLGVGGMAEVFRARDGRLRREVAVKILSAHRADDPTLRRYFRREARAAATLNHRNAVAVYDTGEHDDAQYIVMELVEGPTLQEVIRDDAPLPVERALQVTIGVTEALAAAHAAGLVHRDIKPGNIMFADDGEVKVADFGLARAVAATTRTAEVYGSAPYMSPEQARGEHVDARTDLYSLGCVLHEMLTGDPPFTGDTAIQVVSQHLHAVPPALGEVRTDLPTGLDDVVRRALAKDPDDRFSDAGTLANALRAVRDGRPMMAAAPPATQRLADDAETVAVGAAAGAVRSDGGDADGSTAHRASGASERMRTDREGTGPVGGRSGSRRRMRRGLALAVIAAVAVLALIALAALDPAAGPPLLGDDPDTEEPADDPAEGGAEDEAPGREGDPAPPDEDPPPAEEEPPADEDGMAAVREAADEALDLLDEGVREGAVSEGARDDIASYVRDAVDEAEDGDWEDAHDDAATAREKVREHREDGEIDDDWERPLDHALRDLEHAIRDATPRGGD